MAAPTYWADKLVNKIISTRSSRREFLKATTAAGLSISALGAIDALSGYAGVQKTPDKDPLQAKLKQIRTLMWGEDDEENIINMSVAARVNELIKILNQAISQNDMDVALAAAEGLVPYIGIHIAEALMQAYDTSLGKMGESFSRYIVQLLGENFRYNDAARPAIIWFNISKHFARETPTLVKREILSVSYTLIGLMEYRSLRAFQRHARMWNFWGWELQNEYHAGFLLWPLIAPYESLFPSDPDKAIPPELGAYWTFLAQDRDFPEIHPIHPNLYTLGSSEMIRQLARVVEIRCVGRAQSADRARKCTEEGKSPEQREAERRKYHIRKNGMIPTSREKLQDWLKKYEQWKEKKDYKLEPPEIFSLQTLDEVAYNKYGLPTDAKLVMDVATAMLALPEINLEVEYEVLRILGSQPVINKDTRELLMQYMDSKDPDMVRIAAMGLQHKSGLPADGILKFLEKKKQDNAKFGKYLEDLLLSSLDSPVAFLHLAKKLVNTDRQNVAEIRRLVQELMLWYLGRGANRDLLVREATTSLTKENQKAIILRLRHIGMMHPWQTLPIAKFLPYEGVGQDGRTFNDTEREDAINKYALEFWDFLRVYMRNIVVNFNDDRYSPNVSQQN